MTDPLLRQAPGPASTTAVTVRPRASAASRPTRDRDPHVLDLTVIMPTVGFGGDFESCALRVLACLDHAACVGEFVVALDGPAVPTPAWLDRPDVRIIATGSRSGPAVARNAAAEIARGGIVLFVDADVELAPDALERVLAAFGSDPDLVGVFGTYDDDPAAPGLVSQFRNLLHHHTHVSHPGRATTFWTGCGAMRTANFLDVGGFDAGFSCPSVEDIDLGMRVTSAGGRIALDPTLRCKHLKRWTLMSMILTDVFQRAVPWTKMLVGRRELPATLNIDWKNRACGVLAIVLVTALVATPLMPQAVAVAVACGLAIVACHADFYRLCLRKRGLLFAVGAGALHVLFFVYSSLTFGMVAVTTCLPWPAGQPAVARDAA